MKKIERKEHTINASGLAAGRVATQAAILLMGKNKTSYMPNSDCGDMVIIENVKNINFTGQKLEQKKYYNHSKFPGGLKIRVLKDVFKRSPEYLFKKVVYNMLPKNRLRKNMMKRLTVKS